MSIFWRAVSNLKLTCQLKAIAVLSDGASPNLKFYRIHKFMDNLIDDIKNVTYLFFLLFYYLLYL